MTLVEAMALIGPAHEPDDPQRRAEAAALLRKTLLEIASYFCKSQDDCEDAVHVALLKLLRLGPRPFANEGAVKGFLIKMMRNQARSEARTRDAQRRTLQRLESRQTPAPPEQDEPEAAARATLERFAQALERCAKRARTDAASAFLASFDEIFALKQEQTTLAELAQVQADHSDAEARRLRNQVEKRHSRARERALHCLEQDVAQGHLEATMAAELRTLVARLRARAAPERRGSDDG
jgi:RNA polymerase sigma factor (sigma-70 family)